MVVSVNLNKNITVNEEHCRYIHSVVEYKRYKINKVGCDSFCPLVFRKRVMPMTVIEVLTLLLVIFAALSYIDNHKKK